MVAKGKRTPVNPRHIHVKSNTASILIRPVSTFPHQCKKPPIKKDTLSIRRDRRLSPAITITVLIKEVDGNKDALIYFFRGNNSYFRKVKIEDALRR